MTLTGLESALIAALVALLAAGGGAALSWRLSKSQCQYCGIGEMRREINEMRTETMWQSRMIRMLAEKNGIPVEKQIEIEGK